MYLTRLKILMLNIEASMGWDFKILDLDLLFSNIYIVLKCLAIFPTFSFLGKELSHTWGAS
jgi:hypothetical protein